MGNSAVGCSDCFDFETIATSTGPACFAWLGLALPNGKVWRPGTAPTLSAAGNSLFSSSDAKHDTTWTSQLVELGLHFVFQWLNMLKYVKTC